MPPSGWRCLWKIGFSTGNVPGVGSKKTSSRTVASMISFIPTQVPSSCSVAQDRSMWCPWPRSPVAVADQVLGFRHDSGLTHVMAVPLEEPPPAGPSLVGGYATADLDLGVRPHEASWLGMPGGGSGPSFLVVWLTGEHMNRGSGRPRYDVRRWVAQVAATRGCLVQIVWVYDNLWWFDQEVHRRAGNVGAEPVPPPPQGSAADRSQVLATWGVQAPASSLPDAGNLSRGSRQTEATWLRCVGGARRDWAVGAWRDFLNAAYDGPTVRLGAALTDTAFRDAVLMAAVPGMQPDAQQMALEAPDVSAASWLDGLVVPAKACRPDPDVQARYVAALGPLTRACSPVIRAEAGALLAWLAWWHADYAAANALLAACSDSGHRLSHILWQALAHGLPTAWQRTPAIVDRVANGGFSANPPRMP